MAESSESKRERSSGRRHSQNVRGDEVRLADLHASWQWIVGIGGVGLTVIYWGRIVAFIKSILELDEARGKKTNAKIQLRNTQLPNAPLAGDGIEHKIADDQKTIRVRPISVLYFLTGILPLPFSAS